METFALKIRMRYKKDKDLVESEKTSGSSFQRIKPVSPSDKHRASNMNDMESCCKRKCH